MTEKPAFCAACPINNYTAGYVPLLDAGPDTLVVGEAAGANEAEQGLAFVGGAGSWLNNLFSRAGVDRSRCSFINVLGCQPRDNVFPTDKEWRHTDRATAKAGVEYCNQHHFTPGLVQLQPNKIIALGDKALHRLTGKSSIMVWRGSVLPTSGGGRLQVVPTLHPAALMRSAELTSVCVSDLRKPLAIPPEHYELFAGPAELERFTSPYFAFDFEWDKDENITIAGLSDRLYYASVGGWNTGSIPEYRRIFESATDLIGHNIIGADTKYFEKLGWNVTARMHDTMLKQHLVQPDYPHSLAFVSSVFTNKPFWKGRGSYEEDEFGNLIDTKVQWRTWDQPEAVPRSLGGYGGCGSADEAFRLYNARDTDASLQINAPLDELLERYALTPIYWNVSIPISYICRDISDRGLRIDGGRVKEIRTVLGDEIELLERTLPVGLRPYERRVNKLVQAPPGTYKTKLVKCRGVGKTRHDAIQFGVSQPTGENCPTCGLLKEVKLQEVKKIKVPSGEKVTPWNSSQQVIKYAHDCGLKARVDRKRGTESADVNTRKSWGRTHAEFRIIDRLKDLSTERNSFARQSMEGIDRVFFRLNPCGTSEGRFSSSGQRRGIDPNIQNQPKSIRRIYMPDRPDYSFIELDYASGENFLTAVLARDFERLERLRQPGYSEHLEVARRIFNLPATVTKREAEHFGEAGLDLYDVGKHINHGSNYGMTFRKLGEYLEMNGFFYSENDCKEFMAIGKSLNPRTALWQAEVIEMARRDGFLRNPFGRMRWFSTRSVATESLAFLPASTLADIIIRAMIAHYPSRFGRELVNLGVGCTGEILPAWVISIQIHDSLVLQGPDEGWREQAARTKAIMTQPWRELDGFQLGVEVKYKKHSSWGELEKVEV